MDIKVELESLARVAVCMRNASDQIETLKEYLNPNSEILNFWIGRSKDVYKETVRTLHEDITNYATKLDNSATVLKDALDKYKEIESALTSQNINLSANDIF